MVLQFTSTNLALNRRINMVDINISHHNRNYKIEVFVESIDDYYALKEAARKLEKEILKHETRIDHNFDR